MVPYIRGKLSFPSIQIGARPELGLVQEDRTEWGIVLHGIADFTFRGLHESDEII